MSISIEKIREVVSQIQDPDTQKPLGEGDSINDIEFSGKRIKVKLKLTNPAMHHRQRMTDAVQFAVERAFGKEFETDVEIEVDVPKKEDKKPRIPGVKNIVAVASGKGGVGKSTITANLAVGLVRRGFKVGLVDADIYGPSMPIMLDAYHDRPGTIDVDGTQRMTPVETHGLKLMSIGFFADPAQAIVWRGAMATKALRQMFMDTWWGELDYLLIDLPPGTGDIHLTAVQTVPLTAGVVVTTPQEISLADARKGVAMFKLPQINVPVLGIIENMSWFTPEELPENKYYIFGKEGAKGLADEMGTSLLGQLPLIQSVREAGDAGRPAILQEETTARKYLDAIIDNVISALEERNDNLPETEVVEITRR
ncbi:MAG: Mrp/NBP35 family ATP-binding protein [Flavobacteriales bacterium]|nr:Mrp/NBP35 family ATP-binding protein [Flavobacteriales bacterium]NNK80867.1 Mrp/NBP35 family ATP-binding protein [Flavobacteriales bacterium]